MTLGYGLCYIATSLIILIIFIGLKPRKKRNMSNIENEIDKTILAKLACIMGEAAVAERMGRGDAHKQISMDNLYVVWFTYTLGNWKSLLSTDVMPGVYYEVTHNASKGETYVDVYQKMGNEPVSDDELNQAYDFLAHAHNESSDDKTSKPLIENRPEITPEQVED